MIIYSLEAPSIIVVPGPESMRARAGTTVSINYKADTQNQTLLEQSYRQGSIRDSFCKSDHS